MVDPVSLIARPLVNKVVSLTSNFIIEQYHLVYGVKDEVVKLESNLTAIQATLMEVEGILSDATSQRLQDWLVKLKDSAFDVQDVLEIYAAKASRMNQFQLVAASPLIRREASLNIKKIAARINEISVERKNLHDVGRMPQIVKAVPKPYYGLQQKGSSRDSSQIFGREEEKEKIVSWMLSDEFEACVLPIIGMAGLGKTTLAQLVFNDGRAASHFDHRIWIDVTILFNLEKIGKEIIEGVTEAEHPLSTWSSIVKRIDEVLHGKRFLLVLDDMWNNERFTDWEKLWQLLKKGRRGSRVMITTRIAGTTKTVAAKQAHFLEFLSEEACWSVFANIAFSGNQPNCELSKIGKRIVQECKGLPVAVSALAFLLRGCTDVREWQRVMREGIWGTELKNAANRETNILPALRLSYDHLPSHLKQCFSYCCIFPKGHVFDPKDLVKLWMAEGFIDSGGHSLPEEIGSDYFEELRSRSFFHLTNLDGRQGYRIHDFLHDLAAFVSGQSCQVVNNKILDVATNNCRYLSFSVTKDVQKPASEILKFTKLRTFLLPTNGNRNFGQALDKMFNKLEYLRVLDLSSSTLIDLPESIEKLLLLRYLDLSQTEIRKLPNSVCKLVKLQTLKLLGCLWLSKLPKDLGSLTNLRHLELDDTFWYKCSSLPSRIGNLTNLQNLHSFPVVRASGCGLEQLRKMKYLTGKLWISKLENAASAADANLTENDRLEELVLEWSEQRQTPLPDPTVEETIIEKLEPHSNIQRLQVRHYKGNQFPTWMANLTFQNLSRVSFGYCVNIRFLSCGLLSHVSELYIKGMLELEEWREAIYPSLKRLQISRCPKLRSLSSSFQKLRIMKIKSCDMLKNLPVTPSLKSLILIDNMALETGQEEAFSDIETSNLDGESTSEILFSNLKIVNCPKLKDLRPTFKPHRLEISNCPLLKRLLVPQHSLNLEHVAIGRCSDGTLVEAIPNNSSVHSLVLSNIANLISLPVSLKLQGLKSLYIHECEGLTSLSNGGEPLLSFSSLKLLSVCDCPKLITFANSSLPTSLEHLSIKKCSNLESLGLRKCLSALVGLKDIYLEDCPKLKSFPEDGPPTSLNHLSILGCPLLSQRFKNEDLYRQMIAHITDLEIDST